MLRRFAITLLYFAALFFSVPLSLAVWYVRKEFIQETSVVGDSTLGGISGNTKKTIEKDANENFEVRVVERIDH